MSSHQTDTHTASEGVLQESNGIFQLLALSTDGHLSFSPYTVAIVESLFKALVHIYEYKRLHQLSR